MKKEYIAATCIAILVIIFVNAPMIYFTFVGKAGLTFLGRRVVNSQDMYTYLSFIEQAKQGKWIFENLFTTVAQKPSIIRPSYAVIGKSAALFHLSSLDAYQASRVVVSVFFCFVLYLLLVEIFQRPKQRLLAYFIVLTSSGLGWLLGRYIEASSDAWIPESNVFMSLAESPHFILSQALMIVSFLSFLKYLKTKKMIWPVLTIICSLFLAFDHPFDLMTIGPVLFFTGVFSGAALLPTLIISFLSTIGIIYPLVELKMNPVFASEQAQGVSYSPSWMSYLSGIGLLFPLSLTGANIWLHDRKPAVKLILLWMGIGVIMVYAPVSFQRRLSEGISIPLGILASMGTFQLYGELRKRYKKLALPIIGMIVGILMLSSVKLVFNDFQTIGRDSAQNYYYYVSVAEHHGFDWLETHTEKNDVILANWFYGNLIPGTTGRRVYVGHKAQTIEFNEKVAKINTFLLQKDDAEAKKFLADNGITYIYVGASDSLIAYGFKPAEKAYLKEVWNEGGAVIYQVIVK